MAGKGGVDLSWGAQQALHALGTPHPPWPDGQRHASSGEGESSRDPPLVPLFVRNRLQSNRAGLAHSASMEALYMRPPPTRLCPAKGGTGLRASVLQCYPGATHSIIP